MNIVNRKLSHTNYLSVTKIHSIGPETGATVYRTHRVPPLPSPDSGRGSCLIQTQFKISQRKLVSLFKLSIALNTQMQINQMIVAAWAAFP